MERFLDHLADTIAEQFHYTEDQRAVVRYGLVALLQTVIIFFLLVVLGLCFGFFPQALAVFFSVVLLRRQEGGAHASSLTGCLILSGVVLTALAVLSRYVLPLMGSPMALLLTAVLGAGCVLVSWKLVPVESPNKPLRDPKKIARLRRNTFLLLAVYLLLAFVLALPEGTLPFSSLSISLSILSGTVWQTFTLTKPGRWLVDTMENLFRRLNRS
ncbi:MAG: accessory gene regulator B family protein [Firmicutes bacterium]|nr:accessory gene regulator B family protein [Bacillota bacterium]